MSHRRPPARAAIPVGRLAAALLAVVLAACGELTAPLPPEVAPLTQLATSPSPTPTESPTPPARCKDPSGEDPTASLRPPAEMPTPMRMPAGSFMRKIQDDGKLVVGVSRDTFLFGYDHPLTHRFEGLDIDLSREVAKAIFGTVGDIDDHINFSIKTSAERIPAIRSDQVDLVVRTMTVNCERWQDVDFSTVYYVASQKVLVREDAPYRSLRDLRDKPVCVNFGTTSLPRLERHEAKVKLVGKVVESDCLVALQRREVEAISNDDTVLAGLQKQDQQTKLLPDDLSEEPYGIAISKKHPEFTRFVNGVLENLRASGRLAELYEEWLGDASELTIPPAIPTAKYLD